MSRKTLIVSCLLSSLVTGCATPFGQKLEIDYSKRQIPGSIIVSNTKLFRREALINERKEEIARIDRLLGETEKEGFAIGPDALRELEVIETWVMNAAVRSDPAAGRNYRLETELADLRQAYLRQSQELANANFEKEAALFREEIAKRKETTLENLGQSGEGTGTVAPPSITPPDTSALTQRADALQATGAARLGAAVPAPRGTTALSNPFDRFRDIDAYRRLLRAARNALALDELHDQGNAALYRLAFEVTVLPPPLAYRRTAGAVVLEPIYTPPDEDELVEIYRRWLSYLSRNLNADAPSEGRLQANNLLASGTFFDAARFAYPDSHTTVADTARCVGLTSINDDTRTCGQRTLPTGFLPQSSLDLTSERQSIGSVLMVDMYNLTSDTPLPPSDDPPFIAGRKALAQPGVVAALMLGTECAIRPAAERRDFASGKPQRAANVILSASISYLTAKPLLVALTTDIERSLETASEADRPGWTQALHHTRDNMNKAEDRARSFLRELGKENCGTVEKLVAAINRQSQPTVPESFKTAVSEPPNMRIYDVAPREQAQQISTVARAANTVSVAAALSAQRPASGLGLDAGLAYLRSAAGKVDALERMPLVIGFAQAGDSKRVGDKYVAQPPQFGWVLGPRINTIDARRGRMDLEQVLKPYDLSVDLSVEGWRTKAYFTVRSAWAPEWNGSNGVMAADADKTSARILSTDLSPSDSEFGALTSLLAGGETPSASRPVSIGRVLPDTIKACKPATILLEGENLWRASNIVIGGTNIGAGNVSVLPNMAGISVTIDENMSFPHAANGIAEIRVPTPYGIAERRYLHIEGDADCQAAAKAKAAADAAAKQASGPAVTAIRPSEINACQAGELDLEGSSLEKLIRVKFGAATGVLPALKAGAKDVKLRTVTFTDKQMDTLVVGDGVPVYFFFDGEKAPASKPIKVTRNCRSAS